MTFIDIPQSSDEFPVGMKFTREPIENPLAVACGKGTMYEETCKMMNRPCKFTDCRGDGKVNHMGSVDTCTPCTDYADSLEIGN